jgi:hypothetical protein
LEYTTGKNRTKLSGNNRVTQSVQKGIESKANRFNLSISECIFNKKKAEKEK